MSLRLLALPALLLAASLPPSGAAAQDLSTNETRKVMAGYAECVVKRRPAKASEAILGNVDNDVILRDYKTLIIGDCLVNATGQSSTMSFGGDLYRYALADALVSRELAGQPVPDFSRVPLLEHPEPPEKPSEFKKNGKRLSKKAYAEAMKDHASDIASRLLSQYGECVVRTDPAGSYALVTSKPTSAAERARFEALRPALAACLAEGQTLEFGMTPLRGAVAINYYRLAHAARGAATKAAE